jgi:hypothetical protein
MGRKQIDITKQKFGALTALKDTVKKKGGTYYWVCKCDCGKFKLVLSSYLRDGKVRSCGCRKINDLKYKKFGDLIVIGLLKGRTKNRARLWLCQCACGKYTKLKTSELTRTYRPTKSCGCRASVNLFKFNSDDERMASKRKSWEKARIKQRDNLTDTYIKSLIWPLKFNDIPLEMVKAKRAQIMLHRQLQKCKEVLS